MSRIAKSLFLICLLVVVSGCNTRTDKTDGGGVLLSVSDFDGLPILISVNAALAAGGLVQVGTIDIQNVTKDPTGLTSDLMNVEIRSYEVTYTRGDEGTRVPMPFVRGIFGVAPVGGTLTYDNLPVMSRNELDSVPLADLLFVNGGFDQETGRTKIVLNLHLRFFGKTLSGKEVQSEPVTFTVDFIP